MPEKIAKSTVLYVFQPDTVYFCSQCAFISPEGHCTDYVLEDDEVKPYGGCNDWQPLSKGRIKGNHGRTREETGYAENKVGFTCGRCEEFLPDIHECEKVKGAINPRACCNRWEKDPVTGDLDEAKLRSMKEFR
jgi:hypothetical protein